MLRVFGSPSRYIQGPNAIEAMGPYLSRLGSRGVLISDRAVLNIIAERVLKVCKSVAIECDALEFSGGITPAEVDRAVSEARSREPSFIIGAGGGKGIDAGKAVANALNLPVVTIPTVASNDAPTSKNYVLYDEHHKLLRVEHMKANPEVVVVDTQVIVNAPAHLFTAGIGDALSKKFEVAQAVRAGGNNMFGALACRAASALAEMCYETLRRDGVAALKAVKSKSLTPEVDRVVEATVLHSGLGFESGGLSIAHAMTRGLSAVRGSRDALHGHQVAYALLVQLTLEHADDAFMEDMREFYRDADLPPSLRALGMEQPTEQEILNIASATMTAPHVKNFERTLTAQDIAVAIVAVEGGISF